MSGAGAQRGPRRAGGGRSASPYPPAVDRLIEEFARLPGIGRRSAERLAFHVLKQGPEAASALAGAITAIRSSVRHCTVCYNLTEADPCGVCADAGRDRGSVLVVEQPRDLLALEQTGMWRGVFHVLLGRISPLEGVGPGDLTVDALLRRLDEPARNAGGERVREVVLGLNPTLEGDGTALLLADEARKRGVKVSRLARGLSVGSTMEHTSKAVLADALSGRRPMEDGEGA